MFSFLPSPIYSVLVQMDNVMGRTDEKFCLPIGVPGISNEPFILKFQGGEFLLSDPPIPAPPPRVSQSPFSQRQNIAGAIIRNAGHIIVESILSKATRGAEWECVLQRENRIQNSQIFQKSKNVFIFFKI